MHGCGVVTASKACTKAWVTCVATCDATKFRGGNLRKMEQKCSESRDNWLWSVTLIGNSGHHIYISTRMNCKTHGFLANPANKTVETSSQTHGLLRAPSPCFCCETWRVELQDCIATASGCRIFLAGGDERKGVGIAVSNRLMQQSQLGGKPAHPQPGARRNTPPRHRSQPPSSPLLGSPGSLETDQ